MKRAIALLCLLLTSCSVVTVHRLPSEFQPTEGEQPPCTQSTATPGADVLLALIGIFGAVGAHEEASREAREGRTGDRWALASVGLGLTGALAATSAVIGFSDTYQCRRATEEAGLPSSGSKHWAIVVSAGLLIPAAILSARSSGGGPDSCEPGETITAECRDGSFSCSKHRRGTCSQHGGVLVWRLPARSD